MQLRQHAENPGLARVQSDLFMGLAQRRLLHRFVRIDGSAGSEIWPPCFFRMVVAPVPGAADRRRRRNHTSTAAARAVSGSYGLPAATRPWCEGHLRVSAWQGTAQRFAETCLNLRKRHVCAPCFMMDPPRGEDCIVPHGGAAEGETVDRSASIDCREPPCARGFGALGMWKTLPTDPFDAIWRSMNP